MQVPVQYDDFRFRQVSLACLRRRDGSSEVSFSGADSGFPVVSWMIDYLELEGLLLNI
jgi:hypothetical protein